MKEIIVGGEKTLKNMITHRTYEEREAELKEIERLKELERKRIKKSPYQNYVQYNLKQTENMIWLIDKSPTAAKLLLFIIDKMDKKNALVCSNQVLMEQFNISKSTVIRNIKLLENHKFIKIAKSGTTNVYHINSSLFWKNTGNKKWQAQLSAEVVITSSEQSKELQEEIIGGYGNDTRGI